MYQQVPELEQRLSELQAQIDRLSLSLHLWRQTQDHLQPMERRLAQLTDQCAEILDRWTATGERHAQVVTELETRMSGWNEAEARLQQDAAQRIQSLERLIEREWSDLRRLHQEPLRELREQAASLGEVSMAAAQSAHAGVERAEARLAAIETDLHRWMGELARQIQTAVSDARGRADGPAWPSTTRQTSWPLDGVMRLHEQLRQGDDQEVVVETPPPAAGTVDVRTIPEPPESPTSPASAKLPESPLLAESHMADDTNLSERINALERAVTDGKTELLETAERRERTTRAWQWAAVVLAVGAVLAAGFAWQSQRQAQLASSRIGEVERQSQRVRDAADQQIAASRETAAREMAQARETAARAETIAGVLAAPDLVRYNLVGQPPGPFRSGQMLWSRSRGLVFSGSRLPAPPPNSTYQLWLLTSGEPVSAATFLPDPAGRVTIALDTAPSVPRPVLSASVTIEPSGGSASPSGDILLTRTP